MLAIILRFTYSAHIYVYLKQRKSLAHIATFNQWKPHPTIFLKIEETDFQYLVCLKTIKQDNNLLKFLETNIILMMVSSHLDQKKCNKYCKNMSLNTYWGQFFYPITGRDTNHHPIYIHKPWDHKVDIFHHEYRLIASHYSKICL